MNKNLKKSINVVEDEVYPNINHILEQVCPGKSIKYRVLIWGSVVDDRDRDPKDIDIIIDYSGDKIDEGEKSSIESWLSGLVVLENYDELDCLVVHRDDVSDLISNSRVSEVYCVDDECWFSY